MSGQWLGTLHAGGVLVVDGGTGSELRRRGVPIDRHAWTGPAALGHAETLAAVHADYVRAGADVITTNTFATTRFVLDAAGLGDRFEDVNAAAVGAARRGADAAGRDVAIAGSISCLPPGFDPSAYPGPRAERDAYAELAETLARLGVDLLALEMMEDVEHARRACEAARGTGLPLWLGISARLGADGGVVAFDFPERAVADVLDALLDVEPAVVNVMHTPVEAVDAALDLVAGRWDGCRGVYPELGELPGRGHGPATHSPDALAGLAAGWIERGARVVGGCCGTTPAHVAAIRRRVDGDGPAEKATTP